jgi:hypothetical protein
MITDSRSTYSTATVAFGFRYKVPRRGLGDSIVGGISRVTATG